MFLPRYFYQFLTFYFFFCLNYFMYLHSSYCSPILLLQFLTPFPLPLSFEKVSSPTCIPFPLCLQSLQDQVHLLQLRPVQAVLCNICVELGGVGWLETASVCFLIGGSISGTSWGLLGLVGTAGLPIGSPYSSASSSFSQTTGVTSFFPFAG